MLSNILISAHLILYQRISLAICLEADTFTELIHIINMSHPFCIDYFQKNNTLDLTDLLCLRELCFLGFVKLCGDLLQHVLLIHSSSYPSDRLSARQEEAE